ncbi:AfsR/SARP family transcriptional regulator [Acidaminobacter hydrogenoformans]|uniref:DNA-binding transcriptional activator of the SARP family n=1 Tax=Acidaminobacter hydrogenoformans DSM 2784 TaxID=1120920 RepID=A0A1G5RYI5_9FIRM|nr:BTAD domain-containing putative transcriptional regulator [Acidaminobacter hydrogenoformans]SCZ78997.1 DNA-binding transcriptional activator of the SARP family [Acidaminobacter hydrogenoformans DSM 2784]
MRLLKTEEAFIVQVITLSRVSVITLNGLMLEIDGRNVEGKLSQKSIGLLIYLLLSRQGKCKREYLASLFWDDSSLKSSRNNLRHALWEINKLTEKVSIITGDQSICCLNPEVEVYIDALELDRIYKHYKSMALEPLMQEIEIYQNDFLENEYFNNAPEINDWTLISRNHYQKIYFEILSYIGDQLLEQKVYEDSLQYYLRLLKINPLHEDTYLKIMNNRINANRRVEAIKFYQDFEKTLRNELNIEPGSELQNIYRQLMGETKTQEETQVKASVIPKSAQSAKYKKIQMDGTAFISFELCSRLLESLFGMISMSAFSEDQKFKISYLAYIYPDVRLMEGMSHQSTWPPSEMQIYYGLDALFSQLSVNQDIQIHIFNFNNADETSKKIINAIDYQLKLQNRQLLKLS